MGNMPIFENPCGAYSRYEITKDIPLERLEELCQAERDNRCVVLPAPAKEGEKKPSCFYNDCSGIWCLGMSSENDDEPTERCKKCWYCENGDYAEEVICFFAVVESFAVHSQISIEK